MTLLEELAQADVPGAKIRLALMRRGAAAERERIIKLLEDELLSDDDSAWQTRDWAQVERQQDLDEIVKEAIALIKGEGENK